MHQGTESPPCFPLAARVPGDAFAPLGPSARFPNFVTTTHHSDSQCSSRLASPSQVRAAIPRCAASSLRRAGSTPRLGLGLLPAPVSGLYEEAIGPPRFLGSRLARAALSDPGRCSPPGPMRCAPIAPRPMHSWGSATHNNISGLYRAAHASAVYASQPSSHSSTQDSLPAGGQPSPCGIFPRVTPLDRFSFNASPRLNLLRLQASPGAHKRLLGRVWVR